MAAPAFITIKTSLGFLILNTEEISYIQRLKQAGGIESKDGCIIMLKQPISGYSGLSVSYSYEQMVTLLEAQFPRQ
jgi:hypothetical protein